MAKYKLTPIDQSTLNRSVKDIYRANCAIPVLLNLADLIDAYCGKDGEYGEPTDKWFDEVLTEYTSGTLQEVIKVLSNSSSNNVLDITNKFGLEID